MMAEKDGGALVSAAYRDGDGVTFKINTQHTHGGTPVAPLGQQPQLNVPEKMSHPRHGDDTTVYVTILTTEAHPLFFLAKKNKKEKRVWGNDAESQITTETCDAEAQTDPLVSHPIREPPSSRVRTASAKTCSGRNFFWFN